MTALGFARRRPVPLGGGSVRRAAGLRGAGPARGAAGRGRAGRRRIGRPRGAGRRRRGRRQPGGPRPRGRRVGCGSTPTGDRAPSGVCSRRRAVGAGRPSGGGRRPAHRAVRLGASARVAQLPPRRPVDRPRLGSGAAAIAVVRPSGVSQCAIASWETPERRVALSYAARPWTSPPSSSSWPTPTASGTGRGACPPPWPG